MFRTLLFLILPSSGAFAADSAPAGINTGTYLQASLALAVVVAVLIGTAWLARKVSGGKGFGQGGMKMIGGIALGPRERIVLVEIGDDWLVIGLIPGQIRTLHKLPKGSALPGDLLQDNEKPFAQWLKGITERQGNV